MIVLRDPTTEFLFGYLAAGFAPLLGQSQYVLDPESN